MSHSEVRVLSEIRSRQPLFGNGSTFIRMISSHPKKSQPNGARYPWRAYFIARAPGDPRQSQKTLYHLEKPPCEPGSPVDLVRAAGTLRSPPLRPLSPLRISVVGRTWWNWGAPPISGDYGYALCKEPGVFRSHALAQCCFLSNSMIVDMGYFAGEGSICPWGRGW